MEEMTNWLADQRRLTLLLQDIDAEIVTSSIDCFESHLAAARFLTMPARGLGDKIPVEVAKTMQGKDQVFALIKAIDHGVYL